MTDVRFSTAPTRQLAHQVATTPRNQWLAKKKETLSLPVDAMERGSSRSTALATIGKPAPRRPSFIMRMMRAVFGFSESWERYEPRPIQRSPSLPVRIEKRVKDVPRGLRDLAYSSPLDLNYEGDFVVPGHKDVAARFNQVMAMPNWPQFVRNHLSVGKAQPGDPLRMYVGGLNTPIGENERRMHVVARETGFQFAQLDNATSDGLPPVTANVVGRKISLPTRAREWTMAALQRFGIRFGRREKPYPVNSVRAALADLSDPNQQLAENTQRLILSYIDRNDEAPLELWGYSEGTLAIALAMRNLEDRYLSERMLDCPPKQRDQRLAELRARFAERCDKISAIFVGSAAAAWDAPIRRIDFFAAEWRDKVVLWTGPSRRFAPVRAVVDLCDADGLVDPQIAYPQPFNKLDAHNLFASGAPALSVYMERNNVRTVKGLYDAYNNGTMISPSLAEVNQRIRDLGAVSELWDKSNAAELEKVS